MIKTAIIRKYKDKYRLYSKHKDKSGKRKLLGESNTLKGIKERERQVQYFKHNADDGESQDKETQMLSDLSDIAEYLEKAGFINEADEIYVVMNSIDGFDIENDLVDGSNIPDAQMNIPVSYIGGDGVGGGYSTFSVQEAQKLDDHTIQDLDKLNKTKPLSKKHKQEEEFVARTNGLSGNSPIDNANSGMWQGFSDSYFYRGSGSVEGNL